MIGESDIEFRRRRLLFRSAHRGSKELDLILGPFAKRHLETFDTGQLDRYELLLEIPDPELYNWLVGRAPVPDDARSDVMDLLLSFDPSRLNP